jgi:ABC-type transport system involved in multi-copper enzyme maturation permease subunit
MKAIALGFFLHNYRRGPVLLIFLATAGLIVTSVDEYTAASDLQLGDSWTSRLALWGSMVLLLTAVLQELPKEMSSRFHLILLSKPIGRSGYLLGKLLGGYVFAIFWLTALLLVSYGSLVFTCREVVPLMSNLIWPWVHYALFLWLFCLIAVLAGAFLGEAFCIMAVSGFVALSFGVGLLPALLEASGISMVWLRVFYYAVPNFQYFGPSNFDQYDIFAPICVALYIIGYSGLLLPWGLFRFERISFQ